MDIGHLIAVGQILVTLVVAVIGGLMKRALSDMDRRYEVMDRRLTAIEQDVVSKEDWLRDLGHNRIRQEKILEELNVLKGHQSAAVEIGSAIAAALNRSSNQ